MGSGIVVAVATGRVTGRAANSQTGRIDDVSPETAISFAPAVTQFDAAGIVVGRGDITQTITDSYAASQHIAVGIIVRRRNSPLSIIYGNIIAEIVAVEIIVGGGRIAMSVTGIIAGTAVQVVAGTTAGSICIEGVIASTAIGMDPVIAQLVAIDIIIDCDGITQSILGVTGIAAVSIVTCEHA